MNPIDTDIRGYIETLPPYGEALNFLRGILHFQAGLAEKIEPGPHLEPAVAQEKWQGGQPLFMGESLPIPPARFLAALSELRPLLPAGGAAQIALDRLLASSLMTPPDIETLLNDLSADSGVCLQRLADATSTNPDTLAFLLRTVLSPFFEKWAMPYQGWVETAAWRHGLCPVCGSEPWLARLTCENGQRILACSLCRTEWPFDRLRCPFCEGDAPPQLRYFTVDDDEAHRVECCDRCQRYLKTVDERVMGRPANLPVEDIVTAHLDELAQAQGYR